MKLYSKPELNVEAFDVEDIITVSKVEAEGDQGQGSLVPGGQSAGMEFDINVDGNEF